MDHYQIIAANFQDTIETIAMSVDTLAGTIEKGSQLMVEALLADRKIIPVAMVWMGRWPSYLPVIYSIALRRTDRLSRR